MVRANFQIFSTFAILTMIGLVTSGCMSSPTYGTDKTATAQLLDDLGNVVSLSTAQNKIDYQPRPDLVTPPSTGNLPVPQTSLAKNNPQWPESPEETRARLLAEVDANQNDPTYVSPLKGSGINGIDKSAAQQRAEYLAARKIQNGQYKARRFLTDPPKTYRVAATTAPVGEVGRSEAAKERERLKAAEKKGTGKRWWQVWR